MCGYDPDAAALAAALERGAVGRAAGSIAEAVANADVVFVAAPVGVLPAVLGEALGAAGEECVVTDVGSTKRGVVDAIADPRFVGGHPLAGAETAGVAHARADLFDGATWYLTPTPRTTGVLYERLFRLLRELGARPVSLDARTHDRLLATVSHLPHVLANVLVAQAARALDSEGERLPATGPSFRDATRVAGASTTIWRDIYLSNAEALSAAIDDTVNRLEAIRGLLVAQDGAGVAAWNDEARESRRRLLEADLAGGPVHELRATVPNRPGVVADVALALGAAGVNILDMALYPAPDHSTGVVALWIAGDDRAALAQALLGELGHSVARADPAVAPLAP